MTKGTFSFGRRHIKSHKLCKRCGKHSLHVQKNKCSSCGYPTAKKRTYNWSEKSIRRRLPGTGRLAHVKTVQQRFKNGFRSGIATSFKKKLAAAAAQAKAST